MTHSPDRDHPSEGRLRAYLDRELSPGEQRQVAAHLETCQECRATLVKLERRAEIVAGALRLLDTEPPMERARKAVKARLAARDRASSRNRTAVGATGRRRRRNLAAGVLLAVLAAGTATALPASPVHGWMGRAWDAVAALFQEPQAAPLDAPRPLPSPEIEALEDVAPPPPPVSAPEAPAEAAPAEPEEAGLRMDAVSQPVWIALHDLAPGAEVVVAFVDGEHAGVFTPVGSRFRTGTGRIEVSVLGASVRVEVPRSAEDVLLMAGGRTLLVKDGDSLAVEGRVRARTGDRIVFVVRDP